MIYTHNLRPAVVGLAKLAARVLHDDLVPVEHGLEADPLAALRPPFVGTAGAPVHAVRVGAAADALVDVGVVAASDRGVVDHAAGGSVHDAADILDGLVVSRVGSSVFSRHRAGGREVAALVAVEGGGRLGDGFGESQEGDRCDEQG